LAANRARFAPRCFYRRQAELIAGFDKRIAPVHAFVRMGDAPMLQTGKGTVSILPVDYLFWSPPLEAKSQLASRGWTIVPKAGAQLGQ